MQDLLEHSIWLEEDILEPSPGTSQDASNSIPMPGDPPREDGPIPTSEVDPGPSVRLIKPSPWLEGEVPAIVRPPSPMMDW
jgi:hypothetical protein